MPSSVSSVLGYPATPSALSFTCTFFTGFLTTSMAISPVTPEPSSASALTLTVPSPIASTLAAESSALTIFKMSALSRVNLTLLSVASAGDTIASTSVRSPSCILRLPAVSLMLSTFLTTGALLLYTAYTFMSSFTTVSEKKFISPLFSLL